MTLPDPFTLEDAVEMNVLGTIQILLDGEPCDAVRSFSLKEGWVEYFVQSGEDWLLAKGYGRVEVKL